jgi:hypothetical protein
MRKALLIVVTGILTGLFSCGGSETPPSGNGGGASGTGGVTSMGGSTANPTGGSVIPAGCNLPACLANVMQGCIPSGTCVEQSSGLMDSNVCYSNGVKEIMKMNMNTTTMTADMSLTYKKDNAVCYSFSLPMTSQTTTNPTINVKNAAGTTVAIMSVDSATDKVTVTCTGGAAVVINDKCDQSAIPDVSGLGGDTDTCTQGTCTP